MTAKTAWARQKTATPISERAPSAPKLKLIQKLGVGVNTIALDAARERGVAVCNMPGTNSQAVAEMALSLMMAVLRRTCFFDARMRAGEGWTADPSELDSVGEIAGRTVGLVGFGLLAGAAGVMVREALGRQCRRDAIWMMGMAGLGLVVVFSLVDLPFRCPAILFTWVALLAALPRICQNPGSGTPATPVAALSPGKRNGWNPRPSAEGGPGPGRIHA